MACGKESPNKSQVAWLPLNLLEDGRDPLEYHYETENSENPLPWCSEDWTGIGDVKPAPLVTKALKNKTHEGHPEEQSDDRSR
jgi:hypothetical protein